MKKNLVLLISILFFLTFSGLKAQEVKKTDARKIERKKIYDLFYKSISRDSFKDTNMIYMFAYKVDVRKNKRGVVEVLSINVSDTVAKSIFKNLDFLKQINYGLFMGKSSRSTFVFPIAIMLEYPQKKNAGYINQVVLGDKLINYWFLENYIDDPIETYFYFPALIVRTSTVEDI